MRLTKNGYSKYVCVSPQARKLQGIDDMTNIYYIPPSANVLGNGYLVFKIEGNRFSPKAILSAAAQTVLQIMAEFHLTRMNKPNLYTAFMRTYGPTKAQTILEGAIIELINKKKVFPMSAHDNYVEIIPSEETQDQVEKNCLV